MKTRNIKVSIPEEFLNEVDQCAKAQNQTRTAFVRQALERYIANAEREEEAHLQL